MRPANKLENEAVLDTNRTSTGIQLGHDAFDESRVVMIKVVIF